MGYTQRNGTWRHAQRTAVFVGDYIDAGPQQMSTVDAVRRMVEEGAAHALMGNHEFNAICWFTPDPELCGDYLRSRNSAEWGALNRQQHAAFLTEFEKYPSLHSAAIEWFLTLPLWFEADGLRVIHACWDEGAIQTLTDILGSSKQLTSQLMPDAQREGTRLNQAVERILKGQEIALPEVAYFNDAGGIQRTNVRRRWWDGNALTYRTAALLTDADAAQLPQDRLPSELLFPVNLNRLTFFGHYCLQSDPRLSAYMVCVDTCAAKGKRLTADRWDGEATVSANKFHSVAIG
jgi:hypothetical protein